MSQFLSSFLLSLTTRTSKTTSMAMKMFINDYLERVKLLFEKVFVIFLLVLEHVVVVGIVVVVFVVHGAVGVDEKQGGGRGGGEGDSGRPG